MDDAFRDEIDEALKIDNGEAKGQTDDLPEAPASVSVKAWYKGFGVLFTMRDVNAKNLFKRTKDFIDYVDGEGWKNVWDTEKPTTSQPTAPQAPVCAYHNKPMNLRKGQYGDFWSCGEKLTDGTWCKYKPPKSV